jgi:Cof subfamily protein (haloacid dehalogenase superfamily)
MEIIAPLPRDAPAASVRALFIDLDGTLLMPDKNLSPASRAALKRCRDRGIRPFVATARPPSLPRQLGLDAEAAELLAEGIFCNGAVLGLNGKTRYRFIEKKAIDRTIDVARSFTRVNIALQLSEGRHAFLSPLPPDEGRLWGLRGPGEPDIVPFPRGPMDNPDDVAKIILFSTGDWIREGRDLSGLHASLLAALGDSATLYLSDHGTVVQVMGKGVSKKSGIEAIALSLGLAPDRLAVFGDDVNDEEMLEAFPNSVAMGNAAPEIRALAAHVTSANAEDGVARAIGLILEGRLFPRK